MELNTFFRDFYCLPIRDILVLLAVATWCFLRLQNRFHARIWWKLFLLSCLLGSIAVILHQTVWNRGGASENALYLIPFHSYREVINGGNPEILRSNFMNVILFYPAGLLAASLLPQKWSGWLRVVLPVLLLVGFSAGIEYYQYFYQMGLTEIDDVIHNSMGALLGCVCSLIPLPQKK